MGRTGALRVAAQTPGHFDDCHILNSGQEDHPSSSFLLISAGSSSEITRGRVVEGGSGGVRDHCRDFSLHATGGNRIGGTRRLGRVKHAAAAPAAGDRPGAFGDYLGRVVRAAVRALPAVPADDRVVMRGGVR